MQLYGVVKGKTIELEADPELPDGQRVLVDLEISTTASHPGALSDHEFEHRIASDPDFEGIRHARALRERIARRRGGNLIDSTESIREDRMR